MTQPCESLLCSLFSSSGRSVAGLLSSWRDANGFSGWIGWASRSPCFGDGSEETGLETVGFSGMLTDGGGATTLVGLLTGSVTGVVAAGVGCAAG